MEKRDIFLLFALVTGIAVSVGAWWYLGTKEVIPPVLPHVRVVNVLRKKEFDDAHIKGSFHMDFDKIEQVLKTWEKDIPVVFYCSNYFCTASGEAAEMFTKAGFKNVHAYEGGMAEWYQLHKEDPSYEIEGPCKQEYLTMVVPAPAQKKHEYSIISAEQLKSLMKEDNIKV